MSVPSVQTQIVEVKHCLGHETHVKKCQSREELRKVSAETLKKYESKSEILEANTYMVIGKEKRKLFGHKKVYDLYLKFKHSDNQNQCDHFAMDKVSMITADDTKIESTKAIEDIFAEVFAEDLGN